LATCVYLAGVTENLGLTTGVIILPQRQTALFAKQAADVELFSDGRLRLGVGVGWNWVEYDGLEMSGHFRRRGKRQEQQIALIRSSKGGGRPRFGATAILQVGVPAGGQRLRRCRPDASARPRRR
jgi:alkanesulfonate monooxygenase SsuD/methylene tetrahydromethanopterin reductase-like flavin-dependent oxidoreductase (luciferase family)